MPTNIENKDPVLSNGKRLSDLIDHDKREISMQVLSDPAIYALELKNLWSKAWVVVGHESEIPAGGEFVTRKIGDDSVIVVRKNDGTIECLLNVCSHRGMPLCRTESGQAPVFTCCYHGWTFGQDGSFRGAPFIEQMYPQGLCREDLALRKARVELFAGIIFANWSPDAPTLDEYLGDIKFYLGTMLDRTGNGVEVLGPPQRFMVNSNWKLAAEQASGDSFHSVALHRSLVDLGVVTGDGSDPATWGLVNIKVSSEAGHGLVCIDMRAVWKSMAQGSDLSTKEKLTQQPPCGLHPSMLESLFARYNAEELDLMANTPPSVGLIFPNIMITNFYAPLPSGGFGPACEIRVFHPCGPDKFEYLNWVFVEKGTPQELRNKVMATSMLNLGASGIVEQDDNEVWPALTRSAQGAMGQQGVMRYYARSEHNPPEGWAGKGLVYADFAKDDNQWNFWKRYFQFMTGTV